MLCFANKTLNRKPAQVLLLLLSFVLASCGGLTPKSGNGKGTTSTSGKSSNKSASTLSGKTTLNAASSTNSSYKLRLAWEGSDEIRWTRSGTSVEADKRGDMGVFCFGNETDCREAHSGIRNMAIGGTRYGDNPVAITGLELQFAESANSLLVDLVTAIPDFEPVTGDSATSSRAEMWFRDINVLTYDGGQGLFSRRFTKENFPNPSDGGQSARLDCYSSQANFFPSNVTSKTVTRPNTATADVNDTVTYQIFKGPRIFTGFGFVDHGTKVQNNVYMYGRLKHANVFHLGIVPGSSSSQVYDYSFVTNGAVGSTPSSIPSQNVGIGKDGGRVHTIRYDAGGVQGEIPADYKKHVVIGLCIRNSPIMASFVRTNRAIIQNCANSSESCN